MYLGDCEVNSRSASSCSRRRQVPEDRRQHVRIYERRHQDSQGDANVYSKPYKRRNDLQVPWSTAAQLQPSALTPLHCCLLASTSVARLSWLACSLTSWAISSPHAALCRFWSLESAVVVPILSSLRKELVMRVWLTAISLFELICWSLSKRTEGFFSVEAWTVAASEQTTLDSCSSGFLLGAAPPTSRNDEQNVQLDNNSIAPEECTQLIKQTTYTLEVMSRSSSASLTFWGELFRQRNE